MTLTLPVRDSRSWDNRWHKSGDANIAISTHSNTWHRQTRSWMSRHGNARWESLAPVDSTLIAVPASCSTPVSVIKERASGILFPHARRDDKCGASLALGVVLKAELESMCDEASFELRRHLHTNGDATHTTAISTKCEQGNTALTATINACKKSVPSRAINLDISTFSAEAHTAKRKQTRNTAPQGAYDEGAVRVNRTAFKNAAGVLDRSCDHH